MKNEVEYRGSCTMDLSNIRDRFSYFHITGELVQNIPLEKQIIKFFYDQLPISGYGKPEEYINSGLRKLWFWVNSLEEFYFISGYFKAQGFKLSEPNKMSDKIRKPRLYFTRDTFDPFKHCIYFSIDVRKRDYLKFMRSIKELRNIYNYHTLFWKSERNDKLILI